MLELRKFVAPEFIIGPDAVQLIGRYLANFGARKVLLVTDQGVIAAGIVEKITKILISNNLDFAVFSDISANPRDYQVTEGAKYYQENHCDIIVAVGGGSPMDCAKGIGIVSTNGEDILAFEGIDNVDVPGPPLICIPTTSGTAADVSQFAIISNTKEKRKIAIISKTVVPDVALIDPVVTISMPSHLTACTGLDALVHAIEAYVSTANSPILDLHALEAVRLVAENLSAALQFPEDIAVRAALTQASLQAGLAFSNASLGAVHAMAHSLGGALDLPHGECNAILLDHVIAFNFPYASSRYRAVGKAMGLELHHLSDQEAKSAIIAKINKLKQDVGITSTLVDWGAKRSDLSTLASKALSDPCMVTNPRQANQRDLEVIYEEAL